MTRRPRDYRTEPAHSLLHNPSALPAAPDPPDAGTLLALVEAIRGQAYNNRQREAFARACTERLTLLWGPPGTGKTTVLAGVVLGYLEEAWRSGRPIRIGVGSSNYNAIDNVLSAVAELLERRAARAGAPPPVSVVRVRGESRRPPEDARVGDIERGSPESVDLALDLCEPGRCLVVGGTWMQLGRLAQMVSEGNKEVARWFDLLLIDEASQVPVGDAAAYWLLLAEEGKVVLAGDHKQLGPIYGFAMQDTAQGMFDCVFTYLQEAHGVKPVALDRNYRTNAAIADWPKTRFYSEGYEASDPARRLGIALPGDAGTAPPGWPARLPWSPALWRILDPDLPVAVVTYRATTYTLSNPFEAQLVTALAWLYRHALATAGVPFDPRRFWTDQAGIVTPHRAQMAQLRNLLVGAAGMPLDPSPFVDTVERFQGLERDLMLASYAVADRDFVRMEEAFILAPRRFNVALTRARSKFILLVSDAIVQHLPADAQVARDAAHLQLFVEDYCAAVDEPLTLPFDDSGARTMVPCRLRGRRFAS